MLRNKSKHIKQIFFLVMFLLILMPLTMLLTNCQSPAGPDLIFRYRTIKVVYQRNPANIVCEEYGNAVVFRYKLYDPNSSGSPYVTGVIHTEKVSQHKYVGQIDHVFIQEGQESPYKDAEHSMYVDDSKLYNGLNDVSCYTADGLSAEGVYDVNIQGYTYYFKARSQDSSSNTFTLFIQEK